MSFFHIFKPIYESILMDGRTHRYFSDFLCTITISLMTAFFTQDFLFFCITIAMLLIGALFYSKASGYKIDLSEHLKTKPKNDDTKWTSIQKKITRKYEINEEIGYFFLFGAMIFTIVTSNFLPEGKSVSIGLTLPALIINSYAGATYADRDWDHGEDAHRSFFTHSWVIPYSIWAFAIAVIPYSARYNIFPIAIFCIGYASHLFADRVLSTIKGLKNIIKEFFTNWSRSPGDIRGVPEKSESPMLFISGFLLCACFGLSIPRMYGTHGFTWDISNPNDIMIYILLGSVIINILIWVFLKSKYTISDAISDYNKEKKREKKKN